MFVLVGNFLLACHFSGPVIQHEQDFASHPPVLHLFGNMLELHLIAMSFDGVALSPGVGLVKGKIVGVVQSLLEENLHDALKHLRDHHAPNDLVKQLSPHLVKEALVFSGRRIDFACSGILGFSFKKAGGTATSVKRLVDSYVKALETCSTCALERVPCKRSCVECKNATMTNFGVPALCLNCSSGGVPVTSANTDGRPCNRCCRENLRRTQNQHNQAVVCVCARIVSISMDGASDL